TTLNVAGGRASALVADDSRLYIASKAISAGLHIYDIEAGTTTTLFPGEGMSSVALSVDGRTLEVVSRDLFRVNRVDLATLAALEPVQLPGFPRGHHIAVTP
ncbi:MAG: hypothetical protein GY926_23740, partial [bacterium]|nr:hypothetical protein [bacterium]